MLRNFHYYFWAAIFNIVLSCSTIVFAQETDSEGIDLDQLEVTDGQSSDSLQELEEKVEETEQMLEDKTDGAELNVENAAEEVEQEAMSEVDKAVENAEQAANETIDPAAQVTDEEVEKIEEILSDTGEPQDDQAETVTDDQSKSDDTTTEEAISDDIVSDDEEGQAETVVSDDESASDESVTNDETSEQTVSDDIVTDDETTQQTVSDDVVTDDDPVEEQTETVVSDDVGDEQSTTEKESVSDDDTTVEQTTGTIKITDPISTQVGCSDVCRDEKTGLPIKVLPRPFSNVYADQDSEEIVVENVETFEPWYVKQRANIDLSDGTNPKGWYQVSKSIKDDPTGWMKAADVLEWHQALVMAYTHPGDLEEEQRSRVLMFSSVDDLKGLVESGERESKATEFFEMLKSEEIPEGVISKEPEGYVSITDKFYMLPIVDYDQVSVDGDDTMYLQIAAAVPQDRGVTDIKDPATRKELTTNPADNPDILKNVPVDVVFVMDMTASMQPYIDATKNAIEQLAERLAETEDKSLNERIKFGLVGYRDNIELVPDLEFVSKNFTPELVDSNGLASVLDTEAKAATVSSKGYAEDVFSGVATAINDTAWSGKSIKIMVLIGDSSGHLPGSKGASSAHAEEDLRQLSSDRGIHTIAVHMNDQKHQEDAVIALKQYAALSRIEGSQYESALVSLDSTKEGAYNKMIDTLVKKIDGQLTEISSNEGDSSLVELPSHGEDENGADNSLAKVFNAALVEYLGKETNPPKDFTAWVWDRDLTDPTIKALDVRVLLSKAQLNDMAVNLKDIRKASLRAESTSQGFFDALKAVSAQASKDPEKMAKATNLVDAGLLPSFIESLPYKSDVLSMTDDQFSQMSAEERVQLDQSLRQKIAHYETISNSDEGWVLFNETDPLNDQVYPLSISMLP